MPVKRVFCLAMLTALTGVCLTAIPAMADETIVLCATNQEPCKAKNQAGEAFTASHPAVLDFGELGEVFCTSTINRDAAGQVKGLSFAGCNEGCTVSPVGLPYKAELASPNAGNGKINISGGSSGEPKLAVACGGVECIYGLGVIEAEFTGGKPATMAVNESMTGQTKSFFCPKTAEWKITYYQSLPAPALYIAKRAIEGPMFCEVEAKVCPQESTVDYAYFELQPKAIFTVTELVGGSISCSEANFLLQDGENPYLEGPWRYKVGSTSECTHPIYSSCKVSRPAPTYYANLLPYGNGDGEAAVVAGASKAVPALDIECTAKGVPFACTYVTEEFWLEFSGGEPGTMHEYAPLERVKGSAAFCPLNVLVEADYEATFTHGLGPNLYLTET